MMRTWGEAILNHLVILVLAFLRREGMSKTLLGRFKQIVEIPLGYGHKVAILEARGARLTRGPTGLFIRSQR